MSWHVSVKARLGALDLEVDLEGHGPGRGGLLELLDPWLRRPRLHQRLVEAAQEPPDDHDQAAQEQVAADVLEPELPLVGAVGHGIGGPDPELGLTPQRHLEVQDAR